MEVDDPMTVYTVNNPYEAEDIKTALQGQGVSLPIERRRPSRAVGQPRSQRPRAAARRRPSPDNHPAE